MFKINKAILILGIISFTLFNSCKEQKTETKETLAVTTSKSKDDLKPKTILSKAFNEYWYAGEAEITSYKLEQARYGEIRNGKAVMVYVTEDFLPEIQVKADNYSKENIPVLKLNATRNFNTGIYPYSIMESTFYPVANNKHAIKVSTSVQEWCGHVYAQLNNRDKFEIESHSYFQNEADQTLKLDKTLTENEIWAKLRIDPKQLPVGTISMIPSLAYTRLKHAELKAYKAIATLGEDSYSINYPDLNRNLTINFNSNFPYDITSWEDTHTSGYGTSAKTLTTKATKLETIKSAYWSKNSNSDEVLREKLKLQ